MRKQFHCLTEHFLCALFHNYQLLDKLAHDDTLHRERLNNLFFSKDTLNYYGSLIYSLFFTWDLSQLVSNIFRFVRVMEDRPLQELPSQYIGGFDREDSSVSTTLDTSL